MKKTLYYIFYLIIILLSSCSGTNIISKFIPSEKCTDCEEFINKISILKNDSNFLNNSNYCLDFFITKGDSCLKIKHFKRQDFQESIYFYKKAIEIDTSNQEVAFKIAYLYDLLDSINEAQYYYNKINKKYLNLKNRYNNKEFPEIDVEKIKRNFQYNDSIVLQFMKYGKKAAITFDFDYDYTYCSADPYIDDIVTKFFEKKRFLTIFGNGEFETREFYRGNNNSKTYFQGKLPDSTFIQILKSFENIRFLSLQNLFGFDYESLNHFIFNGEINQMNTSRPNVYNRISINTPDYYNSISTLGMSYPHGIWKTELLPRFPVLLLNEVNQYQNWKKLYKLYELWSNTFNENLWNYKYTIKFLPKNYCKDCNEFVSKISILKDDTDFTHNSNFCFDYFITKGDSIIRQAPYYQLDLLVPISYYRKAFEIDTSSQEAAFKTAYMYDLIDSTNSAKNFYGKIHSKYLKLKNRYNNKEFPEINVDEIKKNFFYNDSIIVDFIKFGKESSITFDFDYDNSHVSYYNPFWDWFSTNVFLTIYGNGEFETRGYFWSNENSKTYFKGKLPDSLLTIILKTFENVRFLTFKKLFDFDEFAKNSFEFDSRRDVLSGCGVYLFDRTSLKTPSFSNSLEVWGLSNSMSVCGSGFIPISIITWDNVKSHQSSIKLYKLYDLWRSTFNNNLLKYKRD